MALWVLVMVLALMVSACSEPSEEIKLSVSAAQAVQGSTGLDEFDHDTLAYLARIEAVLLASSLGGSEESLHRRLDTLWEARYESESGGPGWGLPYAWDAFRDETLNPSDTIYTYTTAMAALAFLDGYVALDDLAQLERAKDALDTLLVDCWGFVDGPSQSVWYSDQPQDQLGEAYVVHNVNALTLAVLARIARYEGENFELVRRRGIESMLVEHSGYRGVEGQWKYQVGGENRNDLVHHAYIALGLLEAGHPLGDTALQYMWSEWFDASTGDFDSTNREVMGSTAWGPGDALLPLTAAADWETQAGLLANRLVSEVDANGVPLTADPNESRSIVRYGLGPALYAARAAGAESLFR